MSCWSLGSTSLVAGLPGAGSGNGGHDVLPALLAGKATGPCRLPHPPCLGDISRPQEPSQSLTAHVGPHTWDPTRGLGGPKQLGGPGPGGHKPAARWAQGVGLQTTAQPLRLCSHPLSGQPPGSR